MSWGTELGIAFALLAGAIGLGMRIPFGMGVAGLAVLLIHSGTEGWITLGITTLDTISSFTLSAAPLFIVMSALLLYGGMSKDLFDALSKAFRKIHGSLYYAAITGCGIFAALAGSSMATTAAVGVVAIPEMDRRGYDRTLTLGTMAGGGTLGILIPPSIPMILYGEFTEQNVGTLFFAGVIPGICLMLLFMAIVFVRLSWNPALAPKAGKPVSAANGEGLSSTYKTIPIFLLILSVIGSIYSGSATPTEAASVGVVGAILINWIFLMKSKGGWKSLLRWTWNAAIESIRVTCFILFIVLGATIFAYAISNAGLSGKMVDYIVSLHLPNLVFLLAVYIIITIMGFFIEAIAIISLTTPIIYPIIVQLGINPIWYGIILVVLCELAQLTPPMGINLFVVQGIAHGSSLGQIIRGTAPFMLMQVVLLALLTAFPVLALWLPSTMH